MDKNKKIKFCMIFLVILISLSLISSVDFGYNNRDIPTTSGSSGNASWNQTFADLLYAGIEWDYNQTTATYDLYHDSWGGSGDYVLKTGDNMTGGLNMTGNLSFGDSIYGDSGELYYTPQGGFWIRGTPNPSTNGLFNVYEENLFLDDRQSWNGFYSYQNIKSVMNLKSSSYGAMSIRTDYTPTADEKAWGSVYGANYEVNVKTGEDFDPHTTVFSGMIATARSFTNTNMPNIEIVGAIYNVGGAYNRANNVGKETGMKIQGNLFGTNVTTYSGIKVAPITNSSGGGQITNLYGLYLQEQGLGTNAYQFYSESGNNYMGDDNSKILLGNESEMELYFSGEDTIIKTKGSLVIRNETGWGSIEYGNAYTHTIVDNSSDALEYFVDGNFLLNDSSYGECSELLNYTNMSYPVNVEVCVNITNGNITEFCYDKITYPYTYLAYAVNVECYRAKTGQALSRISASLEISENNQIEFLNGTNVDKVWSYGQNSIYNRTAYLGIGTNIPSRPLTLNSQNTTDLASILFTSLQPITGSTSTSTNYPSATSGVWDGDETLTYANDNLYCYDHYKGRGMYNALITKGYGIDLEDPVLVEGIEIIVRRKGTESGYLRDYRVSLTKDGTNYVGDNNADTNYYTWHSYEEAITYGGADELWGTTWTEEEIESANFGVYFQPYNNYNDEYADVYVDVIEVVVYYSSAGSTTSQDWLFGVDSTDEQKLIIAVNNSFDNPVMSFNPVSKYVGIGMNYSNYPLSVFGNGSDSISIYAEKNISATGFITRTSVFDTEKITTDYIKDADDYKDVEGDINHKDFYGYVNWTMIDYSRPLITKTIVDKKEKVDVTYPYTITKEGVDLGMEVDLLRQYAFETDENLAVLSFNYNSLDDRVGDVETEVSLLKSEMCKKDSSYPWCLGVIK